MEILYTKFTKELVRRGYSRRDIRTLLNDIKPFVDYLSSVTEHASTKTITPGHICGYVSEVKRSCTADLMAVLDANNKLCALRMFCLQMFIAGHLQHDYSECVGFIPLPEVISKRDEPWMK